MLPKLWCKDAHAAFGPLMRYVSVGLSRRFRVVVRKVAGLR